MNGTKALVEDTNLAISEVLEHAPCPDSNPSASSVVEIPEESVWLQKLLPQAGVASRHASEDLIERGQIQVDGETVMEMGLKVLSNARMTINSQRIHTNVILQI